MDQSIIQEAAERISKAIETGTPCSPVRDILGETNIELAYAVQDFNHRKQIAAGRKIVGKKIGLTSFAVQKQLGVDQPDFGLLYADTEVEQSGSINTSELLQPRAEAELAFVLKESLEGEITMETVTDAIDYVLASIEIVGSRVENWNIRITDTVADNASASHFVLGTQKKNLSDVDLENCRMKLFKNNEVVSEGVGSACLGNPLNAVLWLAKTMKEMGRPLMKGEVILSGALGPMTNIISGDHITAEIEGFEPVRFSCR
ncbi:MAG: 2-keto-4-pentenoate hydratase [Bacteroidetes bacterium]|nr:2-keto-4-pentenoate hydratase [Bacteroidota bacterium]